MGVVGLHDSTISNLVLRYSPQYYHFVANSTNVVFDNINIAGGSNNPSVPAKNTDGWDTYRSSDITIQNSVVNNGDGTFLRNYGQSLANIEKIAFPSNQIAHRYLSKTCFVTVVMAYPLAPWDSIQAIMTLSKMYMYLTHLSTTQL